MIKLNEMYVDRGLVQGYSSGDVVEVEDFEGKFIVGDTLPSMNLVRLEREEANV